MGELRPIEVIRGDLDFLLSAPLQEPDAALELAREAADHPDGIQAVPSLLLLLERNWRLEWGAPGGVVHAIERFFGRGYEPLLVQSLRRAPTSRTLWMANRLLNGLPPGRRQEYLSVIDEVARREDVSDEVRQAARHFIEFQKSRA